MLLALHSWSHNPGISSLAHASFGFLGRRSACLFTAARMALHLACFGPIFIQHQNSISQLETDAVRCVIR